LNWISQWNVAVDGLPLKHPRFNKQEEKYSYCYQYNTIIQGGGRRRRQDQCRQEGGEENTMEFSSSYFFKISPIIHTFVLFLVVSSSLISLVFSSSLEPSNENKPSNKTQNTFKPDDELQKLRKIKQHLKKINKAPLKTFFFTDWQN